MAPDSFKGSLTALQAAEAMAQGVRRTFPRCAVTLMPVSDGGEGLVAVLTPLLGGTIMRVEVSGPLPGQRVSAQWGHVAGKELAVIEMAEAAGLARVPAARRDPRVTTTYGVGELILAALDRSAREIIVGIGGSATNDGGAGMASALGAKFFDASDQALPPGGASLARLARIDSGGLDKRLRNVKVTAACDVTSPLTGPAGASRVYAPQKGAGPEAVEELEHALLRYAAVVLSDLGIDCDQIPGAGAAGGLGAGLLAFCDAGLRPGIDIVLDATGIDDELKHADLVITGEGSIDEQTGTGKAVSGVVARAKRAGVPVVAVAGKLARAEVLRAAGIARCIVLVDASTDEHTAMADAGRLVADRTADLLTRLRGQTG